jgi:tripeptide aminopeptidase
VKGALGYVFDSGTPTAGIVVSAPSHENMIVEIIGRAAHAGIAPEEGVSAIVAASNAISKMTLGRIDAETTANVGVIQGGKARNIIPDKVTIRAEARSRCEVKLVSQVEHMKKLFEEEAAKIGARAEVKSIREYTAFRWTESDEVVKVASAACRRIGIEPQLVDGGGGSDANVFNLGGVPSVVIGVGYEHPHSSSERMAVADLVKSAEYAQAIIEVAAGVGE